MTCCIFVVQDEHNQVWLVLGACEGVLNFCHEISGVVVS